MWPWSQPLMPSCAFAARHQGDFFGVFPSPTSLGPRHVGRPVPDPYWGPATCHTWGRVTHKMGGRVCQRGLR